MPMYVYLWGQPVGVDSLLHRVGPGDWTQVSGSGAGSFLHWAILVALYLILTPACDADYPSPADEEALPWSIEWLPQGTDLWSQETQQTSEKVQAENQGLSLGREPCPLPWPGTFVLVFPACENVKWLDQAKAQYKGTQCSHMTVEANKKWRHIYGHAIWQPGLSSRPVTSKKKVMFFLDSFILPFMYECTHEFTGSV